VDDVGRVDRLAEVHVEAGGARFADSNRSERNVTAIAGTSWPEGWERTHRMNSRLRSGKKRRPTVWSDPAARTGAGSSEATARRGPGTGAAMSVAFLLQERKRAGHVRGPDRRRRMEV
jgi:hypothetical protein